MKKNTPHIFRLANATKLAFAALVFGCVIPSPASPAININADTRVSGFSMDMILGQSVNSSTDSPMTPITTAARATYPQNSQKEMAANSDAISVAMASEIRFQRATAIVNALAGLVFILILLFGKKRRI